MCDLLGRSLHISCGGGIDLAREVTKYDETREIVRWITRPAIYIAFLLSPAFWSGQRVVAGDAVHFAELRPGPCVRAPRDTVHAFAHLHCLSDTPRSHAKERISVLLYPVWRLDSSEGVQFKGQVGVACGYHLVIHLHPLGAQMAAEASLTAKAKVFVVDETQPHHIRMIRCRLNMRPQPRRGRSMTAFATHALGHVELAGTLRGFDTERMTDQTLFRLLRRSDFEDGCHLPTERSGEHGIGSGMLVLSNPGTVFVLQYLCSPLRLNAPVTSDRRARSGSHILTNRLQGLRGGSSQKPTVLGR